MQALFAALSSALQTEFTANTANGSPTLSSPSSTSGLFVGLPVWGPGIAEGSVIAALTPQLLLSLPATANGTSVSLTNGFQTFSRRLSFTKDVPQPALFLRGSDERLDWQGTQQLQLMKAELWVCTTAGTDPDLAPETPLNYLLDAVASVFAPDTPFGPVTNQMNLGGLVAWCRMGGDVMKQTGDLGEQAIAVADIEIFVP